VEFGDSLVAEHLLIGSLSVSGQYEEAVARGLAVLRQLEFDIPATPSPALVLQAMKQTEQEALMYDFSQTAKHRRVDPKLRNIMKLVDSITSACYHIASPFLPLVSNLPSLVIPIPCPCALMFDIFLPIIGCLCDSSVLPKKCSLRRSSLVLCFIYLLPCISETIF
jgi:hypothetical protein